MHVDLVGTLFAFDEEPGENQGKPSKLMPEDLLGMDDDDCPPGSPGGTDLDEA